MPVFPLVLYFEKTYGLRHEGKVGGKNICFVDLEEFSRFHTTMKVPFFSTFGT